MTYTTSKGTEVFFYVYTQSSQPDSYIFHGDYGLRMGTVTWNKDKKQWQFLPYNNMAFRFDQLEAIAEFIQTLPVPA